MEVFKDIKGFEGEYQVSNMGNVKSLNFNNTKKERLLSTKGLRNGYPMVYLGGKGKGNVNVHRLVAKAFLKRPMGKDQVNHINGIKTDNRLSNLEWVTGSENMQHALKNNLWKPNTEKAREISHKKSSIAVNQINEIGDVFVTIIIFAQQNGIEPEDALKKAYDKISNRNGKLVDGTYVKEEDLSE